ncbi:MAG: helix-turn-helix transcriptional regulator [Candidatus Omnitrophica bacterium]|nr:helix-turn-helix transcriptional regulator [Candidatus Omnitrophota bacterium]
MTETEILAKIENYMKKNNLRQWELAREIGVPEATLNRWLRRKTSISNAYLVILKEKGII